MPRNGGTSTPQHLPAERAARHPAVFLRQFLRYPRQIGSVTPSSRFLEQRIVRLADVAGARTVVELGPGSGGTTRALLAAMPARAKLLAIEINPRFCELVRRIEDNRLVVYSGQAQDLRAALASAGMADPDAVVSGIPFSTIDPEVGSRIIETIWAALAPGGRFVAYQVRGHVDQLSRRLFGKPDIEVALLNVPPLRVFRWRKPQDMPNRSAPGARRAAR